MILSVSIYCTLPHKIDKIQLKKCGTRYEKRKKGFCGQHWTFMNTKSALLSVRAESNHYVAISNLYL